MGSPMKSVVLYGGVLFHYTIMIVTIFPYWKWSSSKLSDGIYRTWKAWEGIWWRCTAKKSGEMWCDFHKDPLFKLSNDLQSWRALMCFACVFSFVAVITTILSMECVKAIEKETKAKAFMSIISGGLVLASATFLGVAVSWYAIVVLNEFRSPYYSERQVGFEFGPCLYIGWVAALVGIVCSLISLSVGCKELSNIHEDKDQFMSSIHYAKDTPQYV